MEELLDATTHPPDPICQCSLRPLSGLRCYVDDPHRRSPATQDWYQTLPEAKPEMVLAIHLYFTTHISEKKYSNVLCRHCLGKLSFKKNGKKSGHCPLFATPPKRVKMGHLLSDYRQKCVNATRDILMSKMTILKCSYIESFLTIDPLKAGSELTCKPDF